MFLAQKKMNPQITQISPIDLRRSSENRIAAVNHGELALDTLLGTCGLRTTAAQLSDPVFVAVRDVRAVRLDAIRHAGQIDSRADVAWTETELAAKRAAEMRHA